MLFKFFGVQNLFFKKGSGGGKGAKPPKKESFTIAYLNPR
jgi:hypothetical protein